jgi:tetratricopeptide (TPR) repeat protein
VAGIADRESVALAAVVAASDDDRSKADALMAVLEDEGHIQVPVAGAVIDLLSGDAAAAEAGIRRLASEVDPRRVEAEVNAIGYALLQSDRTEQARDLFALNTRVFPQAFNTWDSYGESLAELGELDAAIMAYERSLELNPENENAAAMIARIRDLEP